MYKLIFLFVLSSCSVNKPTIDYLKSEKNNKNIVSVTKTPTSNVFNFIKPYKNKKIYNTILKDSMIYLESKDFEDILKQDIKTEVVNWEDKDFKKMNVKLAEFNLFNKNKTNLQSEDGFMFYSFSKEFFFNDNKNCMLYFTKSRGYNFIDASGVLFMRKNGKIWEVYGVINNTEIQQFF